MIDHPLIKDSLSYHPGGQAYLATPYTSYARKGEAEWAYRIALDWIARLADKGMTAVSPVVFGHLMCKEYPARYCPFNDHAFFMEWGSRILRASSCLIVPPIDGRMMAPGIAQEVDAAIRQMKPVIWLPGV